MAVKKLHVKKDDQVMVIAGKEKGKSGKPFLLVCSKCNGDFAVRFVEVTIYQAEVAGFLEKN